MIKSSELTDEQLLKYADEHIQYEYDMLLWSARILAFSSSSSNRGDIGWTIHNSLLETFAIHARNLFEFIYPSNKDKSTDVTINNYIEISTLDKIRPVIPETLKNVKHKANKQVAHVTTDRIEFEKSGKAWNFIQIALEIKKILSRLVSSIPDKKMSTKLKRKISEEKFESPYIRSTVLCNNKNLPIGLEIKILSSATLN